MSFSVEKPGRGIYPIRQFIWPTGAGLRHPEPCRREFAGWRRVARGPIFSLLFLLIFLFPSVCTGEIFVEPRIGFHGVFQLGRPFPLEIESATPAGPRREP